MSEWRVDTEWSRLERVLGGRADSLNLPASALRAATAGPVDPARLRDANRMARARCGMELGRLHHLLRRRGVVVEQPGQAPPASPLYGQLFVRDLFSVVGTRVVPAVALSQGRQPEPALVGSLAERTAGLAPPPPGARLEGGDVLVDRPWVYVGIGARRSNAAGASWLAGVLGPELRVVTLRLTGSRALHLDFALALTGPGRGLVYRPAFADPLPAPLRDYELRAVDGETFAGLGLNLLVLDPSTVVVQARHRRLIRALEAAGVEALGLDFEQHVALGGGPRCATAALVRAPPGSVAEGDRLADPQRPHAQR